MLIKKPEIIKNVLSNNDFLNFQSHAKQIYSNRSDFESGFGRYVFGPTEELKSIHNSLVALAREFFESDTLMPSWCMMAAYAGNQGSLFKHTDDNACTYHLDLSVFQTISWDLWVEHDGLSEPYTLSENEALAMYGETQPHWREPLSGSNDDVVCNAFFFFCEPDHWYFTKGPEYLKVLRSRPK
jgi:hypothetical protein